MGDVRWYNPLINSLTKLTSRNKRIDCEDNVKIKGSVINA
tara:strand:- start:49294 stop:49413 length:120 start_codon:yes stop_codon:yes gene_type:complete